MIVFRNRALLLFCLESIVFTLSIGIFFMHSAEALPPPKTIEELLQLSDLAVQGEVSQILPYEAWLNRLHSEQSENFIHGIQKYPETTAGVLALIGRPKKTVHSEQEVFVATVNVLQTQKGVVLNDIYIPFIRYSSSTDTSINEGPWEERKYTKREHLFLYLKKAGPFYRSVWWNAVRVIPK